MSLRRTRRLRRAQLAAATNPTWRQKTRVAKLLGVRSMSAIGAFSFQSLTYLTAVERRSIVSVPTRALAAFVSCVAAVDRPASAAASPSSCATQMTSPQSRGILVMRMPRSLNSGPDGKMNVALCVTPTISCSLTMPLPKIGSPSSAPRFSSMYSMLNKIMTMAEAEAAVAQQNQQLRAQAAPPSSEAAAPGALVFGDERDNSWRLQTLHEVSEENLSQSAWSLISSSTGSDDKSSRSVYRAGVEALVKEACPERYSRIDELMSEYEGREEVLIGHLSTMLVEKKQAANESDTDYEDGGEGRRSSLSELTNKSLEDGSYTTVDVNKSNTLSTTGGDNNTPSPHILQGGKQKPASAFVKENLDNSSSSSAGSSDWSSDDGLSSIDTSSFATNDTPTDGPPPLMMPGALAAISDASALNRRVDAHLDDGSKPTFIPDNDEDDTENSLKEAIEAGDWKAVSSTAALIATPPTSRSDSGFGVSNEEDLNESFASVTSHEKREVNELEQLVEEGNWAAIMAAATRIETEVSDTMEPEKSQSSLESDKASRLLESKLPVFSNSQRKPSNMVAEDLKQFTLDDSQTETDSFVESLQSMRSDSQTETSSLMGSKQSLMSDSAEYQNEDSFCCSELMKKSSLGSSGSLSFKSSRSLIQEFKPSRPWENPKLYQVKEEIEELVKTVVPEEYDNLDEMLLQFRGREEELLKTLRTMRDDEMQEKEAYEQMAQSIMTLNENDDDSNPSIFESDMESGSEMSIGTSEGIEDIDNITMGTGSPEKMVTCSSCGKHAPTSEYSKAQLGMKDAAMCKGCVEMSV
mmetsp:Transcript_15486/g.27729  ORF Transcript_15486/g.27729 Transcript_15486/m.27729 type:complete len:808 (+) Transcript_15486:208-2631(+)